MATITVKEIKEGTQLYRYVTNHGIGNSCPTEGLVMYEDLLNFKTALYYDRVLTPEELREWDIKDEWAE